MSIGEQLAPLIGRVILGLLFFIPALQQAQNFDYWTSVLLDKGVPAAALVLAFGIMIQLIAGLGLIVGFRVQLAALLLFIFSIVVSVILYDFWKTSDPETRRMEMYLFFKSIGVAGGLLILVGLGSGRFALDNRGKPQKK